MAKPDAPTIFTNVCPVCNRERFNSEEIPRLNKQIAAFNAGGSRAD